MKKTTFLFFFALIINALSFAQTQITDINFANAIRANCPNCIDANNKLTASADTLQRLYFPYRNISTIDGIYGFTNLKYLDCSNNCLSTLASLPQKLTVLSCYNNCLSSLPQLPKSLISLTCSRNKLTSIYSLPEGLLSLSCSGSELNSLPTLPQSLTTLSCPGNYLTALPALPQGLTLLDCSNNILISLPKLPNSLTSLNCYNNKLINLPVLPPNLASLVCYNNKLTALPALPQNLSNLNCRSNQLIALPSLSQKLKELDCTYNQLVTLPILPQTLTLLLCHDNQLTTLSNLSQGLKELNCYNNKLRSLPPLPHGLTKLDCQHNELNNLPALPKSLTELICNYNELTELPVLPPSLTTLLCSYNKNLYCFTGALPPKLSKLSINGTGIKCLPNQPAGIATLLPICSAKSSKSCFTFPLVKGNVFLDHNDDGIKNDDDVYLSSQMIETIPYNYAITNTLGNYYLRTDTSKSTTTIIKVKNSYKNFEFKPAERTINVTDAYAQSYDNQDFRLVPKEIFGDMELSIVSSVQRPGFTGTLTLTYRNIGAIVLSGKIKLEKDPILTFISATPKENRIEGNTITWDYDKLKPFETRSIYVSVEVPATTTIGTNINNKMFATFNVINNYYETEKVVENTTIVGSYDPNDKTANVKNISPKDITDRKAITYTIRFQNTGTYHAERVEVQDTISSLFDLSTLKTIAVSHPNCSVNIETDRFKKGQPTVVKWIFENIFLPDSSANEVASHGFIRYSIQPKQSLPIGTSLENKAYIYFDYNLPIITNTSKVTVAIPSKTQQIETTIPLKIYPNPSSDRIFVSSSEDLKGELSLHNLLGQVIDYQILNQNDIAIFDIQYLPKGIYTLTLKTAQGSVTELVVKQ